jgi:outer membrane protein
MLAIKNAKAARWPTLSASAALSSNYTSNGGQPVFDSVEVVPGVIIPQRVGIERTGYFPQLSDNFSQFAGVTLSVPIFNQWQVNRGIAVAGLQAERAKLAQEQVAQQLNQTVQLAYLDAENALARYNALRFQVETSTEAFQLVEAQFQAGAVDFFSYLNALNNKTNAENQRRQAGYEYLFRKKIVDFYGGQPFEF